MLLTVLLFIIAGSFAGFISGLLGIGGGMIVVPALHIIFEHSGLIPQGIMMHVASGTSLCVMIITTQSSVWAHYHHGNILWSLYQKLVVFVILGTIIGANLADIFPTHVIRLTFGFFLLLVCIQSFLSRPSLHKSFKAPAWLTRVIGFFSGIVSGFLGIGGGSVIIPYLSRCKIPTRKIAAISSLVSLTVAIIGTGTVIYTGFGDNSVPWSTGYIYWPAVLFLAPPSALFAKIGAAVAYKVRPRRLKQFFIIFLLVTATKMIFL